MNSKGLSVKKLYRSRQERYIGGVAGGLAEYFSMDVNIFRILFIIFTFTGGIGLVLYLVALIILPENPEQEEKTEKRFEKDGTFLIAVILILAGAFLLSRELGLFDYFRFWKIPWVSIWAIFMIIIGLFLILSPNKSSTSNIGSTLSFITARKYYRSRENRMIAGVCGGIAENFKIDPSIVRLVWVFASFASMGLAILVYVVLSFVFPEQSEAENN